MRMRCLLYQLVVVAALAACANDADDGAMTEQESHGAAAPRAADPAEVRLAIDSINTVVMAALKAEDNAKMLEQMAPDAIVMLDNHPAWDGRAAIDEHGRAFFENVDIQDAVIRTEHVEVSGDLAVESGSLVLTFQPKNGPVMTDSAKFVTVWKRQGNGEWKIFRDISNSNLPAGSATAAR